MKRMLLMGLGLALCLVLVCASRVEAATITVVNLDAGGEGFNDPTVAAPVGGNDGVTLGEQRLKVFEFAAGVWAARLQSAIEVRVASKFDPLTCNSSSAILGSAGTQTVHRDFAGVPLVGTWYPQALANALAGADLASGTDDIVATFNSSIGTTCSFPNTWYHGLDGNPPGGQIDLASVVIHEIGHGLGFASFVDLASGAEFLGREDAYSFNLEDHSTSRIYPDMSDAERVSASINTGNLHWLGGAVVAGSGSLTSGVGPGGHVEMYAPNPAQPGSSVSHFSTSLFPNEVMEPSYTGANHDIERSLDLFSDIGWTVIDALLCGDATEDGLISSTDGLEALDTSVGTGNCAITVCDVNSTLAVTATDALLILQYSVGQPVTLACP